jgi:hypothetical protein
MGSAACGLVAKKPLPVGSPAVDWHIGTVNGYCAQMVFVRPHVCQGPVCPNLPLLTGQVWRLMGVTRPEAPKREG